MRNKFIGECYRCGKVVHPGEGHFERPNPQRLENLKAPVKVRWLLQHAHCAIRYRDTDYSKWNRDTESNEEATNDLGES